MIKLTRSQIEEIFIEARRARPYECCGLLGGNAGAVKSVYRCKNAAAKPLTEYEADPADLFRAQRQMRERGEQLLAIYHSHPLQNDPLPSETDVRKAFYRDVIYFIVGCGRDEYVLRGFYLDESAGCWEHAGFSVTD